MRQGLDRHVRPHPAWIDWAVAIGTWSAVGAVIACGWFIAFKAKAADKVQVPQGCVELSERIGLPRVLTMEQFQQAVVLLAQLDNEPSVKRCRDAIRKIEARR